MLLRLRVGANKGVFASVRQFSTEAVKPPTSKSVSLVDVGTTLNVSKR